MTLRTTIRERIAAATPHECRWAKRNLKRCNADMEVLLDLVEKAEAALEKGDKAWQKAEKYFDEQRKLDEERARQEFRGMDSNTRNAIFGANVWTTVQNEMVMLREYFSAPEKALAAIRAVLDAPEGGA